jgi:hypothetical protein
VSVFDDQELEFLVEYESEWTSTRSISESVYDFVEENGRTYHNFHNGSEWIIDRIAK